MIAGCLYKAISSAGFRNRSLISVRTLSMAEDSDKVTRAAEEIIKAASSHVDSSALALNREAVEALKQLSIQVASVKESVKSLKESQDANSNTMIQSMASVNEAIATQTKNQALIWANTNASLNSFHYYVNSDSDDCRGVQDSTKLVRCILLSFRKNCGYCIDNRSLLPYSESSQEYIASREKNFRIKLSAQIHSLTGQEPRIVQEDSSWVIYYS